MNESTQKSSFLTTIRWILYLPAAFIASMIAGLLGNLIASMFGGADWYVWVVSGAASAGSFLFVAFYIAPYANAFTKWSTISVVAALGALSATGSLLGDGQKVASFAGLTMLMFSVWAAKQPIRELKRTGSNQSKEG